MIFLDDGGAGPRALEADQFQVGIHHDAHQVLEEDTRLPMELPAGFFAGTAK